MGLGIERPRGSDAKRVTCSSAKLPREVVFERELHLNPVAVETVGEVLTSSTLILPADHHARYRRGSLSPGPHADVGVSHERREHYCGDKEYGHAQQNQIDDVTHVIDDHGALGTQGCNRLG